MSMKAKSREVSAYWAEFYSDGGYCTLCGNTGIVNTINTALTPKGEKGFGRRQFCFCPNGQHFRDDKIKEARIGL